MKEFQKIHYLTGEEILLGDIVKLEDSKGKIVFVVSSKQYSEEYSESGWSYLNEGFGIETEKYGLVHQVEPDEDLIFIKRDN